MKLPPFSLERYLAQHEFSARVSLCSSDCESLAIKDLLAWEPGSLEALQNLWLGYTESQGHPELRAALAGLYRKMGPENILVHAGAEEAISGFMQSLLSPGDHVIVHWPCYQSLYQVALTLGCEVTRWSANPNQGWRLDLEFLKSQIRKNTRAVILNTPHNPTGYLMSRQDWSDLIQMVSKSGIFLFSDEVYRGLEYSEDFELASACDLYERALSLGVMSKSFGLAGLRIGWIATQSKEIYQKMLEFKDYGSICSSAPSEFLSLLALKHKEKILNRNLDLIKKNLKGLDQFFLDHASQLEWNRPNAGCIAFPKLKNQHSAEGFCQTVLVKEGILLAPGEHFGLGEGHFRIGFGRRNFLSALDCLKKYLK